MTWQSDVWRRIAAELVAEGRRHDEAMSPGPWIGGADSVGITDPHGRYRVIAEIADADRREPNAAGIAWLRTNLPQLLGAIEQWLAESECERDTDAEPDAPRATPTPE